MVRTTFVDTDGQVVEVNENNSANATITLKDLNNATLALASISTLTCTLVNAADGATINSRDDQDILNANLTTVTAAGVITLRLQPADNVIVSTTLEDGETESHYLTVRWTWNDGVAVRTNDEEWEILVRQLTDAV